MSLLDHLSESAKKLIDYATFSLAAVSAVSLANAALMATLVAGIASAVLACLRIYDWFKGRRAGHD